MCVGHTHGVHPKGGRWCLMLNALHGIVAYALGLVLVSCALYNAMAYGLRYIPCLCSTLRQEPRFKPCVPALRALHIARHCGLQTDLVCRADSLKGIRGRKHSAFWRAVARLGSAKVAVVSQLAGQASNALRIEVGPRMSVSQAQTREQRRTSSIQDFPGPFLRDLNYTIRFLGSRSADWHPFRFNLDERGVCARLKVSAMRARVWAAGGMEAKVQQINHQTFRIVTVQGVPLDYEVRKALCGLASFLWVPRRTSMHERPRLKHIEEQIDTLFARRVGTPEGVLGLRGWVKGVQTKI
eukprot:1157123-Pelagomonas_calceolata.AAC.6